MRVVLSANYSIKSTYKRTFKKKCLCVTLSENKVSFCIALSDHPPTSCPVSLWLTMHEQWPYDFRTMIYVLFSLESVSIMIK